MLHQYCTFLGNKNDEQEINSIYLGADVLLMLSTTEGFPMAIMEAMARGLAVVTTGVGEIPYHVKNSVNGFVIDQVNNDAYVTEKAVELFTLIASNRDLLETFKAHNIAHAKAYFGFDKFAESYNHLFNEAKKQYGL